MKKYVLGVAIALIVSVPASVFAFAKEQEKFAVVPHDSDPAHSFLVEAEWLDGIGCPTDAKYAVYPSTTATVPYTDPACTTGDPKDKRNLGLLLAKTGPTANNASAEGDIKHPPSTITELGYDIRKPGVGTRAGPQGSHCGAGAPRFDVIDKNGTDNFVGCNSAAPPFPTETPGDGFIRLRWKVAFTDVRIVSIVFDEGYDTGPDFFGLAVLDNIDINGVLVGQGRPEGQGDEGLHRGEGNDNDNGHNDGPKHAPTNHHLS